MKLIVAEFSGRFLEFTREKSVTRTEVERESLTHARLSSRALAFSIKKYH